MYKIAVIGDYDSIYGFAALGLDTFPVKEAEEAEELFYRLASSILRRRQPPVSAMRSKSLRRVCSRPSS